VKCCFDAGVCCTEFGKGLYFKVVHGGRNKILNYISHLREEAPTSFSLNTVLAVFIHLKSNNLPYGVVGIDGHITYLYDWITNSKFIST